MNMEVERESFLQLLSTEIELKGILLSFYYLILIYITKLLLERIEAKQEIQS